MNARIPWIIVVVLAATSAYLGVKLQQKPREVIKEVPVDRVVEKPVQVIKEVPVEVIKEVIKEVPVEVVKMVEKPIPPEYALLHQKGLQFQNARYAPQVEKLKGVKSVYVDVTIPEALKGSITADGIREKIGQELRNSGIQVADQPATTDSWLSYTIEVLKRDNSPTAAFITSLNLLGAVYVSREGEVSKTTALLWTSGRFGLVDVNDPKLLGELLELDLTAFTASHGKANPRK
jgi:hypothetical protein